MTVTESAALTRLKERKSRTNFSSRRRVATNILTTGAEIIRELRRPGKVFAAIVMATCTEYVSIEKQDMSELLKEYGDEDPGIIARRSKDGNLYIDKKEEVS